MGGGQVRSTSKKISKDELQEKRLVSDALFCSSVCVNTNSNQNNIRVSVLCSVKCKTHRRLFVSFLEVYLRLIFFNDALNL